MIDGLKLTMRGEHLIAKLNDRIRVYEDSERDHQRAVDGARSEAERQAETVALEHASARNRGKIETLTLIRDHIIVDEVYRLGEYDLRFADLLRDDDWLDCGCYVRSSARQGDLLEHAMDGET